MKRAGPSAESKVPDQNQNKKWTWKNTDKVIESKAWYKLKVCSKDATNQISIPFFRVSSRCYMHFYHVVFISFVTLEVWLVASLVRLNVTVWCSYESFVPWYALMWLRAAVMSHVESSVRCVTVWCGSRQSPHFTLAHHRLPVAQWLEHHRVVCSNPIWSLHSFHLMSYHLMLYAFLLCCISKVYSRV